MLENVRVVDLTTDIAGPYATKMLADAGADVVKVEPADGDPLRHWGSGALFEFLNTSKRSVNGDFHQLIAGADILVTDVAVDIDELRSAHQGLVVVTITPFGCDGPWADYPSTEFTLQAACGSTGQRGLPEQPPLAAGGRIGEWVTGTYAAVGAVGAYREALRCGQGDHVDVAMFDCMSVAMVTYPSVFASFAGWPPLEGTGRVIEVPSIEPTADGFVVFTTNSAQQFQDFLVMIGRPDLLTDPDLPKASKRFARRDRIPRRRPSTHHAIEHGRDARRGLFVPDTFRAGPRRVNGPRVRAVHGTRGLRRESVGPLPPASGAIPYFRDNAPPLSAGTEKRRAQQHGGVVTS